MAAQIIAIGVLLLPDTGNFKLEKYIVSASGKERPRVLFVPTASGDDAGSIARFYESYSRFGGSLAVLPFFRRTPVDIRSLVLSHDIVHVGGGNTRSMLAVWRDWGMDVVLREAYENGIVLVRLECRVDLLVRRRRDRFAGRRPHAAGMSRIVSGSNCPHYDGERDRRPAYHKLVAAGEIGDGIACDDGVGLHYVDGALHAIPSARPAARAYRVARTENAAEETTLDVLQL